MTTLGKTGSARIAEASTGSLLPLSLLIFTCTSSIWAATSSQVLRLISPAAGRAIWDSSPSSTAHTPPP